jgi:hypothetical protein
MLAYAADEAENYRTGKVVSKIPYMGCFFI